MSGAVAETVPILETRDVARRFMVSAGVFRAKQSLHAVNGVSLRLAKGEVLALVGESGCGKSTLARLLLGLVPPTRGDILFEGKNIAGLDRIAIARRIQPVFQDPYSSLNPRKTIGAVIALPLRVHRIGNTALWRRRVVTLANLGSFGAVATNMAVSVLLPIYVQGVMGYSPGVAGFVVGTASVSWMFASIAAGRLMIRTSYLVTAVIEVQRNGAKVVSPAPETFERPTS